MVVNSDYVLVVLFVCLSFLGYAGGGLSDVCVIVGVVGFLDQGFPSSTFCKAGFVDTYCLNLVL